MKKLFVLLLILTPLVAKPQNNDGSMYRAWHLPNITAFADYKGQDTTIRHAVVPITLTETTLTISGNTYQIISRDSVIIDKNAQWWQVLTLANNLTAPIRRYPNYALMNIII